MGRLIFFLNDKLTIDSVILLLYFPILCYFIFVIYNDRRGTNTRRKRAYNWGDLFLISQKCKDCIAEFYNLVISHFAMSLFLGKLLSRSEAQHVSF